MIKGLRPQLAEAGKIKIGMSGEEATSRGGKKYRRSVKLDHFLVTKTVREANNGPFIVDEAIMSALPTDSDGKVREIPIILHSDDIEAVFPTAYVCYSGRKLFCRGDGETAEHWDKEFTEKKTRVCPCELLNAEQGKFVCKPNGVLHCSVNLPNHAVAGAVHKWRTTSIISIQRMVGSLQQVLATVGVLRGVPLVLRVEPVQVSPKGRSSTVYCCHVELRAGDVLEVQRQAIEATKRREALANGVDLDAQYKLLVTAPGLDETPTEQAAIQQEFYSHNEQDKSDNTGSSTEDMVHQLSKTD